MTISEARSLVGSDVSLVCRDRKGEEVVHNVHVYKAEFLPYYGPCLVTEDGEVPLDHIIRFSLPPQRRIA